MVLTSLRVIASLFIATTELAPQSISTLKSRPTRWKQVWKRPPDPKASPQPTNCNCMNGPWDVWFWERCLGRLVSVLPFGHAVRDKGHNANEAGGGKPY